MATGSIKLASRASHAQLKEMMMGERKHGLYTASARREHGVVHFQLKDPSDHLVAEGSGRSVSEAEMLRLRQRRMTAPRVYLQQVKFPGIAGRLIY
jgi:hypothetical protein